jgi:hypothetical protein
VFNDQYTVSGDEIMKEKYRLKQKIKQGEINVRIFETERYGIKERAVKQLERVYMECKKR